MGDLCHGVRALGITQHPTLRATHALLSIELAILTASLLGIAFGWWTLR